VTPRIPTGFPTLDRHLRGGLRREDLVVLGGDAGIGTSSLATGIALGAARAGIRTVLISTEGRAERLAERALAQLAGAGPEELAGDDLTDARRLEIAAAATHLRDLPLTMNAAPVGLAEELRQIAGLDWELLVIDALEGLILESVARSEAEAAWITRLKRAAIAQGGTVVLTTHLKGDLSAREDPRPLLRDFGADGAIRAQADLVLAVYREEHYRPDRGVVGAAEMLVLKDRGGAPAAIDCWFEAGCRRFEDLASA
jgi:replicative DNA helicase